MVIGDKIDMVHTLVSAIKRIDGVYPVRYDGHEQSYVVCEPAESKYTAMRCVDEDNDIIYVMFSGSLENRGVLVDLL